MIGRVSKAATTRREYSYAPVVTTVVTMPFSAVTGLTYSQTTSSSGVISTRRPGRASVMIVLPLGQALDTGTVVADESVQRPQRSDDLSRNEPRDRRIASRRVGFRNERITCFGRIDVVILHDAVGAEVGIDLDHLGLCIPIALRPRNGMPLLNSSRFPAPGSPA